MIFNTFIFPVKLTGEWRVACKDVTRGSWHGGELILSTQFLNLPVWANFYGLTDLSTYHY